VASLPTPHHCKAVDDDAGSAPVSERAAYHSRLAGHLLSSITAASTWGVGALPSTIVTGMQQVVARLPTRINVTTPVMGRWTTPVIFPVIITRSVKLRLVTGIPQTWPPLLTCSLAIQHPGTHEKAL
jgi:hypothetical protein